MKPCERPGRGGERLGRGAAGAGGALSRVQCGLTLIELMIAMALGLAMVTLVLRAHFVNSTRANLNSTVSEYQTNGRYALETLKREVRHAALYPMVWPGAQLSINATVSAKDYGCGAGVATDLANGVTAANDANPFAATCLGAGSDRQYARGDVLVLRRAELDPALGFDANAPYVRLSYGTAHQFLGGETPAELPPPAQDFRLVSDIYFVNAFTNSPDESPRVPALYRLRLSAGANPVMVPELVASNVEHLQVRFGESMDDSGGIRYVDAHAVTDWSRVRSARVWLMLRASRPEPGFASDAYEIGDVTFTPQDDYRRTVLTATLHLRNR